MTKMVNSKQVYLTTIIFLITTNISLVAFADKDKDKERDFDLGIAEVMDLASSMNTKELTEMCYEMKDDGYLKDWVNCVDWSSDESKNHVKEIKNYATLKGLGLY